MDYEATAGSEGQWSVRNLLKRLFCRHRDLDFKINLYGDAINAWSLSKVYRSLWRCKNCGAIVPKRHLALAATDRKDGE